MSWGVGQRLQNGKYVIQKVLAQGGFGITYKAVHIELNKIVVIKTPNEYLSNDPDYENYLKKFIQEGRILARLSQEPHPHIVGVIDLFKEGNIYCLVMEFVPGENLFETVKRRGALPEAEIVPYIRQIGQALMVVHQAGLVHRDAHPGNIMLRNNGKAVLIDFGIAKELMPNSTSIVGHNGFAPYEQMTSGGKEPTVDVYCLAATLYYAVTGQRPTTSLARKLDNAVLKPPKQIIPSVSERLNQAILKGMELEAKYRPQSMREWLTMLEAAKVKTPTTVEPVAKTQIVRTQAQSTLNPTSDKPTIKQTIGYLIGIWLIYAFIGYSLVGYPPLWTLAVGIPIIDALAVTVIVAEKTQGTAGAWMIVFFPKMIIFSIIFGLPSGLLGRVVGMFWVIVSLLVGGVAVGAGLGLQKYLSRFWSFLIFAGTSGFWLSLGWKLGSVLVHK